MHGDDDGGSSVITFDGDVVIRGTLRDGRTLSTTGLLIVGGAIEAAQVNVNSDAFIKGGIVGKSRGKVAIDGTLRCRFVSAGHIIGAADVIVQSEIAYSSITSAGQVSVLHGPIVGGETIANAGIVCQALGNPSGKLTIVEAGTEQSFINFVASARDEIDRNRARVADVRTKIEPLMKHVKMLTPQQKERATELLYEAGELEARTETMVTTLEARCQAFRQRSNPVIVAHETIYPGVTIRFAGMEARITTAVKGPVKLKPIKTGNITEIAMVDMVDGSTCVLQSNRPAVTVA
jgi:uncharacterized protein (DUF342 family)